MAILTKGNPNTHYEEKRESTPSRELVAGNRECFGCGQCPKTLYKYNDTKGWFCNKNCGIITIYNHSSR